MPVAIEMNFRGATLDQYDRVLEAMGFAPGGPSEPGLLFHWVTKTEDGLRMFDVWESKQQFERFAQERIGPLTQQAGFAGPPEVRFYEIHNYLTAG